MDVADFFAGAGDRHKTRDVYLSPDPDLLSAAQVAARARDGDSLADPPAEDSDELAQARAAALKSSWKFTVRAIPARQWDWLVTHHPPTSDQRQEAKDAGQPSQDFNYETFPHVAIAACLQSVSNPRGQTLEPAGPKWDAEGELQVDPDAAKAALEIWDGFPLGEWKRLWSAVLELNGSALDSRQVQSFANGSATTRSGAS